MPTIRIDKVKVVVVRNPGLMTFWSVNQIETRMEGEGGVVW